MKAKLTSIKQVSSFYMFLDNFKMTFSETLPVVDKKLIGRKFCVNLGSLPGFGKATTFASFQDEGKCESRGQSLIKWVK
jgi:hypothetical protein